MLARFSGARCIQTLVLCLVAVGACPLIAEDARPNFIIFIADDMSWDDCGAYGHPSIQTPNIDRLAQQGMRFDSAYLTCSSCSPSRSSILTGRYPHNTGAGELHMPLPKTQTIMTKPLRESGYWTAAVGKWHLGNAVSDQVEYRRGSKAEKMGDAWVEAVKRRPRDKPFFLWAAHTDPHRDYHPGAIERPHRRDEIVVPPYLPDTDSVRDDLALYYDEIGRFDEHVGMVLKELDAQQVAENTFILVMSDNGRPFPYCKTRVHVPGVKTPWVVRFPKRVQAGSSSESLVSSIDIAPTIFELAGLPPLERFQGVSFARTLADGSQGVREFAYAEHNWHDYRAFERAVHTPQFCYVRNWLPNTVGTPPADAVNSPTYAEMRSLEKAGKLTEAQRECMFRQGTEEYLFDVVADPDCIVNLAGKSEYASVRAMLRGKLDQWQVETADQFPGEANLTPDSFHRDTGKPIPVSERSSQPKK